MDTKYEQFNELTFEAYIKSAIDKSVLKARIKNAARNEKEQSFSALADAVLYTLAAEESEPIQDELDCEVFDVHGIKVPVYGQSLGQALYRLLPQDREIILLHFFLGLNDFKIAKVIHLSRSTVQRRRTAAMNKLRIILEDTV